MSIVLCLFINANGSKHDRQTKLTYFMLLTYTRITSARDEFLGTFKNMNYWLFQLYKEIILQAYFKDIFTLRTFTHVCFAGRYSRSRAVVCQRAKNSHVQFRFVDFWVEVQRGTLSFLEIISLPLSKNYYGFTETRLL